MANLNSNSDFSCLGPNHKRTAFGVMNEEKAQHMCFISCLSLGQSGSGPTQDVLGQCGWELVWAGWEALGTGRDTCDW